MAQVDESPLTCLTYADPGDQPAHPELTEAAYAAVFDAWPEARRTIWRSWMRLTDPANLQPDIKGVLRRAADLVRDAQSSLTPADRDKVAVAIAQRWPLRISREVGQIIDDETSSVADRVAKLQLLVQHEGLEAPPADLVLMSGYHSPQLDVSVRLNTNESPLPPPEEWEAACARWPRWSGAGIRTGEPGAQAPGGSRLAAPGRRGPGLRRERVQRGAAVPAPRLRRTQPLSSGLRADLRPPLPPGRCHRDDRGGGGARRGAGARPRPGRGPRRGRWPGRHLPRSPNNPTGMVEPPEVLEVLLSAAPGLVVVDEALRAVRAPLARPR